MDWGTFVYGGIFGFVGCITLILLAAVVGVIGIGYWEED